MSKMSGNGNLHIKINSFGDEDVFHVYLLDLDEILSRTRLGLVQLIEYIHFRHQLRKNENVRVKDVENEILEYYNGKKWMYGWKGDILQGMMEKGIDVMSDRFDKAQDRLRNEWTTAMYDHVERWLNDMRDRKYDVIDPAVRELFIMLCNNTNTDRINEISERPRTRRKSG